MTLTVPEEIAESARLLAEREGMSPEALLLRALEAHFPPLPMELRAEFDAWEQASDEDYAAWERSQSATAAGSTDAKG
jgi:ferric-dicitrate binding protein FerR (iron transport regulator)